MTIIKYILTFLGGGALGAGVGYFVSKKKFEEQLDECVDEEVRKVREDLKEMMRAVKQADEAPEEIPDEETIEEKRAKAEHARNKPDVPVYTKEYLEKQGYVDYSKLTKEEEENIITNEEIDIPEPEEFELITYEEFNESNGFEKQTLYYLRDKILVDGDGRRFRDIAKYIGYDTLDQFGYDGEDDVIYVRNHQERMDFEIYRREETLQTFINA